MSGAVARGRGPLTTSYQEAHEACLSHCPCWEWLDVIFKSHPFLDPAPVILEEGLLWCAAHGDPVTPQAAMASQWSKDRPRCCGQDSWHVTDSPSKAPAGSQTPGGLQCVGVSVETASLKGWSVIVAICVLHVTLSFNLY